MDYDKIIEECEARAETYKRSGAVWNATHEEQCKMAIEELLERSEKAEKIVDEYAESARAIALWLSAYCEKTLSYPSMISNATRKISVAYADMEKRAEQAEKERDEYKSALQNWHEEE